MVMFIKLNGKMETKDLADKNEIEYTDLSPMGVNSVAFTKENTILILKRIRQENIPILGGDVCLVVMVKYDLQQINTRYLNKN